MKKIGDYRFYLVLLFVVALVFLVGYGAAQQNDNTWKYQGQSLEQIFNSNLTEAEKQLIIERAVLDGKIAKDELARLLDIAVSKGLIKEEDKKFYLEDKGLWGFIKLRASYYYGKFDQFTQRFISKPLWDVLTVDFSMGHIIFAIFLLVWLVLFYPFSYRIDYKGNKVSVYSYCSFFGRFGFFDSLKVVYKNYFFSLRNFRLYIPFSYILFIGLQSLLQWGILIVPARIIEIITLEFLFALKDSVVWGPLIRSFVVAAIISFVPYFFNSFIEYRKRTNAYKDKMEEMAAIEAMKAQLKG